MSSIRGAMNIEQHDFMWLDETGNSEEWPNSVIVRDVCFPGVSAPIISGLNTEIPTFFDTRNNRDLISTTAAQILTGIPKNDLDAWADSSDPPKVSVSWTFPRQEAPVFTFPLCLVADHSPAACSIGSIVFAHDIKSQWRLANSVQNTTAIRASSDSYTIYSYPQQQIRRQRSNESRLPYRATCGKRETRSKRRRTTVSDHQCGPAAASASNWSGAASARPSSSYDTARQVSHSILESTRRHAAEAYASSGSTQGLRYAAELSQRMLTSSLHRRQGLP
ncbi:hypothetical protein V8F06_000606 [Rhypophila decipiens]